MLLTAFAAQPIAGACVEAAGAENAAYTSYTSSQTCAPGPNPDPVRIPLSDSLPRVFATLCVAVLAITSQARSQAHDAHRASRITASAANGTDWCGVNELDGKIWAGSPRYKASFTESRVEFTPALGASAPQNFPISLSLAAIERGGQTIEVDQHSAPQITGERVEYQRSPTVTERYDVLVAGLELSYLFDTQPKGRGDLVVRLAIDTELEAQSGAFTDGLSFRVNEATHGMTGGVDIAAVTGIDAVGRTTAGSIRFDGEYLSLVLPDAFVTNATYPLTLDPLIGGTGSAGVSFDDYVPDVAYDLTTDKYLVTWEFRVSATDTDVWAITIDGSNGARLKGFTVANGAGHQRNAAVANVNQVDSFIVTWQDDINGQEDILARSVRAIDRAMSPSLTIAGNQNDEITPDVGGDATTTDDEAIIVWKEAKGAIHAVEVTLASLVLIAGTPTVITADTAALEPAISKSGGSTGELVAAWQTANAIDYYIAFRRFDRDLVLHPQAVKIPGGGRQLRVPDVDGDGTRWAIVWQQDEGPTATTSDIFAFGFETCPSGICSTGIVQIEAEVGDDEIEPAIAMLGSKYAISWSDRMTTAPLEYAIEMTNIDLKTLQRCGNPVRTGNRIGGGGWDNRHSSIGSKFSGGGTPGDALLNFEVKESSTGRAMVFKQRYQVFGGGPVTRLFAGCGKGGIAGTSGPFALGNNAFAVTLAGADPAASLAALNVGFVGAPVITCGSCRIITPLASAAIPVTVGAAELNLPVPCDPSFTGVQMDAQWLIITSGGTPCPLVPNLAASSSLRMTIRD